MPDTDLARTQLAIIDWAIALTSGWGHTEIVVSPSEYHTINQIMPDELIRPNGEPFMSIAGAYITQDIDVPPGQVLKEIYARHAGLQLTRRVVMARLKSHPMLIPIEPPPPEGLILIGRVTTGETHWAAINDAMPPWELFTELKGDHQ